MRNGVCLNEMINPCGLERRRSPTLHSTDHADFVHFSDGDLGVDGQFRDAYRHVAV